RQDDFLQLMMDAQDGSLAASDDGLAEPDDKLFDIGADTKLTSPTTSKRLSELEAMAQCVLFFLAGQEKETTSSTIAFTAYLLALNQDVQEKLRKEVDDCTEANGPEPSLDVISKLKYLHCVVSEALRLFPPATRLERSGYEDYVLGDTGIKLPKECSILIPVYAMHHDPEMFPDPESFKPERFSDENVESIEPYTYLPFGAGPRNCIGMRFALQSVKLCLFHSLHSVQFIRTGRTKVRRLGESFVDCANISSISPSEVYNSSATCKRASQQMILGGAYVPRTGDNIVPPDVCTISLQPEMNALIQDCARITCEHLKDVAERKEEIDVKRFFGHYSLDVIARCAFGTMLDSHTDATNEFVNQANKAFSARISLRSLIA
ncbi:hypothetical protein MTO96_051015, partial [Rhipicephalus appendiculatus]